MGSTTLLSTLAQLSAINGAMAQPANPQADDYKAMVCILLAGGLDSYNMLIPAGITPSDNGFNDYKAVRSDLALQNVGDLLALNNPQCSGFRGFQCAYGAYGLHPQMGGMRDLFNSSTNKHLAFMANIGTLVEPVRSKQEYNGGVKKLPLGLYSHSDQIMQWQTSVPQSREALGVGGRMADLLNAANTNNQISMNISLAGKNMFQQGQTTTEYSISNNVEPNNVGFQSLPTWWGSSGLMTDLRDGAIDSMVGQTYANLLQQTYSSTTKTTTAAFAGFKDALKKVTFAGTGFPTSRLASDLLAIAKIISVRQELGVRRQLFFVTYGGWDMHDGLLAGLNNQLPVVSQAMKAFYDATVALNVANKVTTFTISDFGRTATSNGQGSDHAWGGNMMVMGGSVKGGKIYGAYPQMNLNSPLNVSFRGNYIPVVSTDEMYAELALWYGVSPSDLCYVLPNIGNFYSYASNQYPVGFMDFSGTTISSNNLPQNCLTY